MRELSLFTGAGGGILGGHLLGWETVCAVEIEKYCIEILLQRQKDGILSRFPIWDDIRTFDGKPWQGRVDIITGGFPCQDISSAGKGLGLEGKNSGLWKEMARIICEVKPKWVLAENSPLLTIRGLGTVLGDLATMGYDARWGVLGACDVGAQHKRERIWILANNSKIRFANNSRKTVEQKYKSSMDGNSKYMGYERGNEGIQKTKKQEQDKKSISNAMQMGQSKERSSIKSGNAKQSSLSRRCWSSESGLGRVADGVANTMDRLAAIGNGQVPSVAATAFVILSQGWYEFGKNNKGD